MRSFKTCLLLAAAAILSFSGCKSSSSSSGESEAKKPSDSKITSNVRSELKHDPAYKFDGVDVATANGVVQLSGFATTEEEKQRAAQVAQSVPGVTSVQNGISLKPNAFSPTGRTNYGTIPPYP